MNNLIIIGLILTPILIGSVAFAYDPIGTEIWFNISPASESTLGGVISMECPVGELPRAIFVNGSLDCVVP